MQKQTQRRPEHPPSQPTRRPMSYSDETGLERMIFFSDAVFAIAVTLLALEIRLPPGEYTNETLLPALLGLWPRYLSYTISFLVIGTYWLAHHRMFRRIVRYDRRLLLLNLLLLMLIGFVPFPTAVMGDFGNRVATIFYALTMATTGLMSATLWWYASQHARLLAEPLTPTELRTSQLRTLIPPTIFLLSIPLALFNATLASLSWILIAPLSALFPIDATPPAEKPVPQRSQR